MRRTILSAISTSMIVALIAPVAMAERGEGPRDRGARMQMIDADGDGQITRDEAQDALAGRLAKLDTDGDGSVSRSEVIERAQAKAAERAGEHFVKRDANGDGRISQDEMSDGRVARIFDRLDTNGDDILSAEEIEAAKEMRGKRGKRAGEHFVKRDANDDSRTSRDEVSGDRVARIFDRLDTNGDDVLSAEEFEAAKEMRGKRAGHQ